jgi:hypothetical protein
MAQYSKHYEDFLAQEKTNFEVVMLSNSDGIVTDSYNPLHVALGDGNYDAFGRQRTSEAYTLGDYKHLYGIDPNFYDVTISGATVTYQENKACARLTVSGVTGSRVIHQTKMYHNYMPGKSQLIKSTFNFYAAASGVTKRSGYYDDNNGIFFEQTPSGELAFNIRTYVSGSTDDATNRVVRSNWNIDKCDGTGPSKFNLDITKTQIFWTDFQWLGVGRVRCGFVHNGIYVIAHEYYNSNVKPTVYMSNPNLPIRCEIIAASGVTASGGYFDQICSTVISEGGYVESGQDWSVQSPTLRVLNGAQTLPIMAIRLKTTYKTYPNRMFARLGNLNVFSTGQNVAYKVLKLPNAAALTGGSWAPVNDNSGVEYNVTASGYTGGEEMDNGYVSAASQNSQKVFASVAPADPSSSAKKNFISHNYYGNDSEIYVVVATNLAAAGAGNTTDVGVGMQWREVY